MRELMGESPALPPPPPEPSVPLEDDATIEGGTCSDEQALHPNTGE